MKTSSWRRKIARWGLLSVSICLVAPASATATEAAPYDFPRAGKSPRPSAREWREEAKETRLTQVTGSTALGCKAFALREWLRLTCPDVKTAAVSLVGGEAKDVYFHVEAQDADKTGLPGGGEVVMALRPGEVRVIQFWTFGPGYDGPLTVIGSLIFQQSWEEDERLPHLILADTLHEPIRTATQEGK